MIVKSFCWHEDGSTFRKVLSRTKAWRVEKLKNLQDMFSITHTHTHLMFGVPLWCEFDETLVFSETRFCE